MLRTHHLPLTASLIGMFAVLLIAGSLSPPGGAQGDPMIAAVGDIACDPSDPNFNRGSGRPWACQMKVTSDLLMAMDLAAVLLLGDNQYEDGALRKYQQSYDPTWGRLKAITRPVPGNHEYGTPNAEGYFAYFGAAAGDPGRGYYSFDIGAWHLIALNSNCASVGGCGAGSPQERWLRADLAAHPARCTLAYWHHPRFSSGWHGSNSNYSAFWKALHEANAEIVLNGHDHDYERFTPQDSGGVVDFGLGIREFVVGTGGRRLYGFKTAAANSAIFDAETFGVLVLTLHPTSYEWKFVPEPGKAFTDSGRGQCN